MNIPPEARRAMMMEISAYCPEATHILIQNPKQLQSVLLEAARRVVEAAAQHIAAAERERIVALSREVQATYWVGPDGSLAPRRPFFFLIYESEPGDNNEDAS